MYWEGDKGSGDRAKAACFPEASSAWNWQLPANFRTIRVEDGDGGCGSFDFGVSQEGPVGIRRLALITTAKVGKGLGP